MFNRRTMLMSLMLAPVAARADGGRTVSGDAFRSGLKQWRMEAIGDARVSARDGILDIDAPAGVTLWFLPALVAPVAIRYEVRAVAQGGPHDAVSDVNAFWMATDPAVPDGSVLGRRRSGAFEDYDRLKTYYVGIGGNRNSTTRMRRYVGRVGERPLLPEHDRSDAAAMLVPNRWTHIRLIAKGQEVAVERDGVRLFTMHDTAPYMRGWFGLRTTRSHLRVKNLRFTRV